MAVSVCLGLPVSWARRPHHSLPPASLTRKTQSQSLGWREIVLMFVSSFPSGRTRPAEVTVFFHRGEK